MLGPAIAGLLAGVLASGTSTPAASTGSIGYLAYDVRPAGMPVTTDPARTVESARGVLRNDNTDTYVHVTLGATPDESNAADVHLVFGTVDDNGECMPHTEIVAPTGGSRTVELAGDVAPLPAGTRGCTYVAVIEHGTASVLDRVAGVTGSVIVDPAAPMRITGFRHHELPVGRWSSVMVHVRLDEPADELRVLGRGVGHGVRTRDVVERDLAAGSVWVRLPVKLQVHRYQKLLLKAGTGDADSTTVVRLEPRR